MKEFKDYKIEDFSISEQSEEKVYTPSSHEFISYIRMTSSDTNIPEENHKEGILTKELLSVPSVKL